MKKFPLPLFCGLSALLGAASCKSAGLLPISASVVAPGASAVSGMSDYRRLGDIVLFDGKLAGQAATAAGGATLDLQNGGVPLDASEKYEDKPAIRIQSGGSAGGNWTVKIARDWWHNSDLTQYMAHGVVSFAIKGARGGEKLAVGLSDMNGHESASASAGSAFTVTGDWQVVHVPISDLIAAGSPFRAEKLQTVNFKSVVGGAPGTVYLTDLRITSPDLELAAPPVKVNQVGFAPDAPKRALVSGFAEELRADAGTPFTVKNAKTGKPVFNGKLTLVIEDDTELSGEKILSAEFGALTTPGKYIVSVGGVGDSLPFAIGTGLYEPLVRDAARYYYYQRSGMALDAAHAGKFTRGVGHPQDAALAFQSDPNGPKRDVSGGWYDAGDYGKYVSMCAGAVSDLMWAYEMYPAQFGDGTLNIPESGNGVPDLLDEIRYELDWVLKMQDVSSGGFYQKVWPNNANVTPDKDKQARYIYDKVGEAGHVRPTASTANAVAILAHASVLYKKADPAFAVRSLAAATKGWRYLVAHPDNIIATGMTGADPDDSDNRVWAAAELYRATGDATYSDYFASHIESHAKRWDETFSTGYGDDLSLLGCLAYGKAANPRPETVQWMRGKFRGWSEAQLALYARYPWTNFTQPGGYFWGSNVNAMGSVLMLAVGDRVLADNKRPPLREARGMMNYILGENPLRFSYVSGYGANSVRHIYSNSWTNSGLGAIPKGYTPGGPNKFDAGVYSRFPAKCYRDVDTDWVSNENAIYYNSPLVFTAALLANAERP